MCSLAGDEQIAELREKLEELAANLQELSSLSTEVEVLKGSLSSLTKTVQSIGQAVQALDQKDREQDAAIAALNAEDPSQLSITYIYFIHIVKYGVEFKSITKYYILCKIMNLTNQSPRHFDRFLEFQSVLIGFYNGDL